MRSGCICIDSAPRTAVYHTPFVLGCVTGQDDDVGGDVRRVRAAFSGILQVLID